MADKESPKSSLFIHGFAQEPMNILVVIMLVHVLLVRQGCAEDARLGAIFGDTYTEVCVERCVLTRCGWKDAARRQIIDASWTSLFVLSGLQSVVTVEASMNQKLYSLPILRDIPFQLPLFIIQIDYCLTYFQLISSHTYHIRIGHRPRKCHWDWKCRRAAKVCNILSNPDIRRWIINRLVHANFEEPKFYLDPLIQLIWTKSCQLLVFFLKELCVLMSYELRSPLRREALLEVADQLVLLAQFWRRDSIFMASIDVLD